jgi:deoxyribodipyrimidine photo-lyase
MLRNMGVGGIKFEYMDILRTLAANPRVTVRRAGPPDPAGACVVYWMQRSQRALDNPALDVAVEVANAIGKPLVTFFAPMPFAPANLRHYEFLSQGIADIASGLADHNIGFVLRRFPDHSLLRFCEEVKASIVIGDENPIRLAEGWRENAAARLRIPLWTVDSDVVVPSKLMEKAQYAVHTIRPRIEKLLPKFLVQPQNLSAKHAWKKPRSVKSIPLHSEITEGWPIDRTVQPVTGMTGGTAEALRRLDEFITCKLPGYGKNRNHPESDTTSRLSPYLHFGHIGPLTVALAVQKAEAPKADREAFLNELIMWRELAINFVKYNPVYDSFECGDDWAHRTLASHAKDPRPVLYTERQLEAAETHDPLWNAAHLQMVNHGWMHNHMRMYWAKKILEWSRTPAQAHNIAVRLNDKYEMDGRDPNGYSGIAWAILGKFDRPWFDRPIFGQIRYMSLESTGKKFNSRRYIEQQTQPTMFAAD